MPAPRQAFLLQNADKNTAVKRPAFTGLAYLRNNREYTLFCINNVRIF